LLAATVPASAQGASGVTACRDIQDSLLRLRCFDETSAAAPATSSGLVVPPAPEAGTPDFSLYAAEPYRGPIRLPDFSGRDREYAAFQSRILAGAKAGPNFAGYLALVEIGCGSSCRIVPTVDLQTGRVIKFPLGGEDYNSLSIKYQVGSRLVSARWIDGERCKQEDLIWSGAEFQRTMPTDVGDVQACYMADD
jgi:hypothetical protein